jgi:hypothetical protein
VVSIEAVVLDSKVVVVLSDMIEITFDEISVDERVVEVSPDDMNVSLALCETVTVTARSSVEEGPPVVRPVTVAASVVGDVSVEASVVATVMDGSIVLELALHGLATEPAIKRVATKAVTNVLETISKE